MPMRTTILALFVVGLGCTPKRTPRLEEYVDCGHAIDQFKAARDEDSKDQMERHVAVVSRCWGTLSDQACRPLSQLGLTTEAWNSVHVGCLRSYCTALPTPQPFFCKDLAAGDLAPKRHSADIAVGLVEFAIEAKRYDIRALNPVGQRPFLEPFEPYLAARAYSQKRWGCGKADSILRLDGQRLALFDGPTLTEIGASALSPQEDASSAVEGLWARRDGGCGNICIAVERQVIWRRAKQVISGTKVSCGSESFGLATYDADGGRATP